jgi:hypothetical protein
VSESGRTLHSNICSKEAIGVVQLTLPDCGATGTLSDVVTNLTRRWAREFGDGGHLVVASQATESRFSEWGARILTHRERERVDAYFNAVVRRALMREHESGARSARRRWVEASIVADLCAAGWDAERAAEEARMVTAGPVCGTAA